MDKLLNITENYKTICNIDDKFISEFKKDQTYEHYDDEKFIDIYVSRVSNWTLCRLWWIMRTSKRLIYHSGDERSTILTDRRDRSPIFTEFKNHEFCLARESDIMFADTIYDQQFVDNIVKMFPTNIHNPYNLMALAYKNKWEKLKAQCIAQQNLADELSELRAINVKYNIKGLSSYIEAMQPFTILAPLSLAEIQIISDISLKSAS